LLRENCGRRPHIHNGLPPFLGPFVQRVQLAHPSDTALSFVSGIEGAHLNYLEPGLDLIYRTEEERDDAFGFLCEYHVKTHHGDQGVRYVSGRLGVTRYSGPRNAPNVVSIYGDKPSRVTGERYCVHIDWRIKGKQAMERARIEVGDLANFDHRAFWMKRLRLKAFDASHLGRLVNNMDRRSKRKAPWISKTSSGYIYDYDYRTGCILMHLYSTQES
jgi:hypothetical protein